ncbi:MAG: RDD family protein [Acidobacteriota bacterium]
MEDGQTSLHALPDADKGLRPLELLSKPSIPPTNPLVLAALRRIERAHAPSQFSGNTAIATAALYEEQPAFELKLGNPRGEPVELLANEPGTIEEPSENKVVTQGEKTHRLSVVSAPIISEAAVTADALETLEEDSKTTVKPKRLIRENDPALNYLDSISITVKLDLEETRSAPVFFRMFSAILDLLVVCLLSAPVVAVVKLAELQWQDPRVIASAAGTVVVAAFLYLTISTALTGRTFAMRLFSLRVVDARTGMIPTGTQSAGRALFYMFSLATAGIGFMFMFVDREKRTAHDRFTRTAVVRV